MVTDLTAPIDSGTYRRAPRHTLMRPIAVVGVTLGIVALATGCSSTAKSTAPSTTTSTVAASATTSVATAPATTTPTQSAGHSTDTTAAPSGPAPVIATFVTPDNIDCHNGNSQNFSASWTTTNAVKTTISIDGPGIYKTYGADGSDSLPFNCSSSHSFLLTAYAQDGRSVTKTITLQPRNVQTTTTNPTPTT